MIICIIGSGGREHAICKTISTSPKVSKIYCLPGNAGTQELAENINLDINDFEKILKFLKESKVDLVIVGPEKPLKFDDNLSHQQITFELNKVLEKMILKNPDQWIWSHDRWK